MLNKLFTFYYSDVPQAATREVEEVAPDDEFGAKDYRASLELKQDHNSRPLWIVSRIDDLFY